MATTLTFPSIPQGNTAGWDVPLKADLTAIRNVADDAALGAPVAGSVPSDGTTDAGPAIQALYDAGIPFVGKATGSYYINTPVFFDRADSYRAYTVELNGAKIILGTNLPTCPAFFRDATTTWGFFGNTRRNAWNTTTNVVTVDDNTRASGVNVGNLLPVVFRNGTVAGAGRNAGLIFNNRCGTYMDRIILSGARCLSSWFDYSDCAVFNMCHNRRDTEVAESALLIQINNGDGVEFHSCKADGAMQLGHMSLCRGAVITGNVTGRYIFSSCSGIVVQGAHQETNIASGGIFYPAFRILESKVTFIGCVFYGTRDAAVPVVEITDNSTTKFSNVKFISCQYQLFYSSGTTPDGPWGPMVSFADEQAGSEISGDDFYGSLVTSGATADGWIRSTAPLIVCAGQSAALATQLSQTAIASGSFIFGRYTGTTWRARPLGHGVDLRATHVLGALTATALAGGTKLSGGSLTSGAVYAYTMAVYDASGNSTAAITEITATTTASGTVRLEINAPAAGVLRIWRKLGAGVVAGPTHWRDLLTNGGRVYVWDTGVNVNGQPWLTTTPPARPATNNSVRAVLIDGIAI
jgi:hypothetical protein